MNHFLLLSAAMTEQEMMAAMSMGNKVTNSLMVMLIGLTVVFLGLVILIVACKILSVIFSAKKAEPKKAAPAPAKPAAPAPAPAPVAVPAQEDDEIAAVIAAVIAAMGSASADAPKGDFIVRRVRRVGNSSNWSRAGREELLSSKYF